MSKPCKKRRIHMHPGEKVFGPKGLRTKKHLNMSLDEYETLRLIDLEGLTQEECSISMEVSRSTVQSIYTSARKKVATAIVEDINLLVGGGDYIVSKENCNKTVYK